MDKRLNGFGYCACCWGNLPDDKRAAISGQSPEPTARTITIHHPTPRMRTAVLLSVVVSVAVNVGVLAAWSHWPQIVAFVERF